MTHNELPKGKKSVNTTVSSISNKTFINLKQQKCDSFSQ